MPSFHRDLVKGVATYAHELFASHAELDVVYVPIGMGSGICGLITVRDLLGLKTEIVGVVAGERAGLRALVRSRPPGADQFSTDLCRWRGLPRSAAGALDIIVKGAARVVRVSEGEIADAVRLYYRRRIISPRAPAPHRWRRCCRKRRRYAGKRVGLILSGGNIDMPVMAQILRGATPAA